MEEASLTAGRVAAFFFFSNKSAATFGCITEDTARKVEIETSRDRSDSLAERYQETRAQYYHAHTYADTHSEAKVSKLALQTRHCREASGQARGTRHRMWLGGWGRKRKRECEASRKEKKQSCFCFADSGTGRRQTLSNVME